MAAAIAVLGFLCGATASLDMDFHWHLALGQQVLANGFLASEPFSHLPVPAPDRQAWLADVAFAVLDRIGGLLLIRIVLGLVFACGCLSAWRLARKRSFALAVALLPVAAYCALAIARLRVRPDLLTLALVPLFTELLEGRPSWRRALGVIATSALWSNLHPGSLIAGLLALAQLWPLGVARLGIAVAAWAGLCLTPDGIHGLIRYTADTTPLRPLIPEWQRLWERPLAEFRPEWAAVLAVIALCCGALAVRLRSRAAPPPADHHAGFEVRELARAALGLALAASAVRFLFMLLLPALWAAWILGPPAARLPRLRGVTTVAALAALLALPIFRLHEVWTAFRAGGAAVLGAEAPGFPVDAARFLAASDLAGNLAHPARWGGYLAWKLDRRFRTATDGRVTHFGAALAHEWSAGVDSSAREQIFSTRGIDLLVVPREMHPALRYDRRYEAVHVDPTAVVLLRVDGPNRAANIASIQRAAKRR